MPSSVSSGSAARGAEAAAAEEARPARWGRAEASGEERRDRGGWSGGSVLAGSQLRLFAAASPPPAGRYGARRVSRSRTELPGLGVRTRRREAHSRATRGSRRATLAQRPAGVFHRGGDRPPAFAPPYPPTSPRGR
ncbi:hypothetical protein mRhiFer1_009751 [Rhinolophus ferrumequinum]|uniref:Uncharacterized protein n=1 Tax=Rhinolophus ferrumequinum TaxID=59479 RepID=A0A7J7ZCN1_RHIFE|nr:hypothetical protein mRhiFer1_009751 [Rhinolophus ferrumequinum]